MKVPQLKREFVVLIFIFLVGLSGWAKSIAVPDNLRGEITVDQGTYQKALAMRHEGWVYVMPEPKSPQAAWGNSDGRTTWWQGY